MDIAIMVLLLVIAILIWRGEKRGLILGLWVIGLVAMVGAVPIPRHFGAGSELLMSDQITESITGFMMPTPARELATYWGLHAWVLGYSVVMLTAFYIQFGQGEFPCPLCMLQRYGMFLSTLGALFVIMQARRGTLTASRYAQGLGIGIIGAVAGGRVSLRQIDLHIKPGDPGYGAPVLGFHMYTWALITFVIVVLYCGVMLMLMPKSIPQAPAADSPQYRVSTIVVSISWLS